MIYEAGEINFRIINSDFGCTFIIENYHKKRQKCRTTEISLSSSIHLKTGNPR